MKLIFTIACISFLILLSIFNVFLAARIGLIAFFVLFVVWFLIQMYKRKQLIIAILSIVFFLILSVVAVFQINFVRWRLAAYIPWLVPKERLVELPHDVRIDAWSSAIELIKEHPVLGVGAGNVQAALNKIYEARHFTEALNDKLNAHSLYFQTHLAAGILADIALLFLIFSPLFLTFSPLFLIFPLNKRSQTVVFWCLLFAIFGLTEATLEVQRGTLFAAFFFSLILSLQEKNE